MLAATAAGKAVAFRAFSQTPRHLAGRPLSCVGQCGQAKRCKAQIKPANAKIGPVKQETEAIVSPAPLPALRGHQIQSPSGKLARRRIFLGAIAKPCVVGGLSNAIAKRQTCQAAKFFRRNCQALRGWGLLNAIAKWQNLPGGEVLSAQSPSPAWLGIVECIRQVAKFSRCNCQLQDCQMQPTGGKTCRAAKFSLAIAKPCGSAKCSRQAAKLARRRSSFGAIAKSCGIGDCRMQPTDGKLAK